MSFTIAAGPRQRSHSWVLVPRDSEHYFTISDSRLPQTRGSGPRIYMPHEKCGPVMPPGTGFPFRRLLRLAGLRWRYSNPPPHGHLKTEFPLNNLYKSSPCLTGNTLRLRYKVQSVNAVRETVAVYCENHKESTNTLRGQKVEFQHFEAYGRYSNRWALKGSLSRVLSLKHSVFIYIYIHHLLQN
jgi:hypothetical protein